MNVKFSQNLINSLEFSEKKIVYKDTQCRYLYAYAMKNSISYYYVRKIDGKTKFILLGDVRDFSYKQIVGVVNNLNIDIANGVYQEQSKAQSISLAELWQNYINHKITLNHSAEATKRTNSRFRRLMPDKLKNAIAKDIKTSALEKVVLGVAQKSERVATLLVAELKAAFNYHIKINDDIVKNPCLNLSTFKTNQRARFLSQDELRRFFKALELSESQDFIDFVKIAIFTGKRKMSILTMEWAEIDYSAKTWTVPEWKNKSGIEDITILDDVVVDILKKRRNAGKYVFQSKSVSGHYVEPKSAWRALLNRADIQDLHIHDLRRTLASVLAGQNVSLHMIANILGQASTGATPIYARFADKPKREALQSAVNEIAVAGGLAVDPVKEAYARILRRLENNPELIIKVDRALSRA